MVRVLCLKDFLLEVKRVEERWIKVIWGDLDNLSYSYDEKRG